MPATTANGIARERRGHQLTREDARKGALAAAEVKRQKKASLRARLQTEVDKRFDELMAAYEEAITNGDPRTRYQAAESLIVQAYGKPAQEITGPDGGPLMGDAIEQGAERFLALVDTLVERAQRRLEHDQPALEQGTNSPPTVS